MKHKSLYIKLFLLAAILYGFSQREAVMGYVSSHYGDRFDKVESTAVVKDTVWNGWLGSRIIDENYVDVKNPDNSIAIPLESFDNAKELVRIHDSICKSGKAPYLSIQKNDTIHNFINTGSASNLINYPDFMICHTRCYEVYAIKLGQEIEDLTNNKIINEKDLIKHVEDFRERNNITKDVQSLVIMVRPELFNNKELLKQKMITTGEVIRKSKSKRTYSLNYYWFYTPFESEFITGHQGLEPIEIHEKKDDGTIEKYVSSIFKRKNIN